MSVVTEPLDDFLARYQQDDNEWWRLDCGHHLNLFDEACEQIELLRQVVRDVTLSGGSPCWHPGSPEDAAFRRALSIEDDA